MSSRSPSIGQQRRAPDRARIDGAPANVELAERQRVLLEHEAHRFQEELRRQVGDGELFLVEARTAFAFLEVAVHQVVVELAAAR